MSGKIGRAQLLRMEADVVDAEVSAAKAKPERERCETCGRLKPLTPSQRKKWDEAKAALAAVRKPFREVRATTIPEPSEEVSDGG